MCSNTSCCCKRAARPHNGWPLLKHNTVTVGVLHSRGRLLRYLAKSIIDYLTPVARKLKVCSPLSGVKAQVGERINCKARMEWPGTKNECNQTRDQPHKQVEPLRRGILNTKKRRQHNLRSHKMMQGKSLRSILGDEIGGMTNDREAHKLQSFP